MTIYSDAEFTKTLVIMLSVASAGMLGLLVYIGIIAPIKEYEYRKMHWLHRIIYHAVPCIVIGIVLSFFATNAVELTVFRSRMMRGEYEVMRGDSLLVSSSISEYRDNNVGYRIVLSDGEKQIEFGNCFTNEKTIAALNAHLYLNVCYGYIGGDPYIWLIESAE